MIAQTEHQIQAAFVQRVLFEYDRPGTGFLRPLFFAVPNGVWAGGSSQRGKWGLINKFKQEGYSNGVADIIYQQPRGPHPFFACEFKRWMHRNRKDKGLSEKQMEYAKSADFVGAYYLTAFNDDEAFDAFKLYMGMPALTPAPD